MGTKYTKPWDKVRQDYANKWWRENKKQRDNNVGALTEAVYDLSYSPDNERVLNAKFTVERIFNSNILSDREELLLRLRYGMTQDGIYHTLEEAGKEFRVTRERIRQMEMMAFDKIEKFLSDIDTDPIHTPDPKYMPLIPNISLPVYRSH